MRKRTSTLELVAAYAFAFLMQFVVIVLIVVWYRMNGE